MPFLRIKPGVLLTCVLGSIQFESFTVQNGSETALTDGVTWSVSDDSVALIGASSGNATGVASGVVTVTATFGTLTATATLTVLPGLNCCAANNVVTVLVVDKSHSMSLQFGSGYATKQAFADAVASNYASQNNVQKDMIGLIEFDDSPMTDSAVTSDSATVATQAAGIVNSTRKTGIGLALQAAVDALSGSAALTKVIVLISDGEDQDTNPANDPVPIATAFKAAGGILVCVGVRAHGTAFNVLNAMSTGGFFLNAYPAVVDEAIQQVYGLKGYICAGNCATPGNGYFNEPALNYTGFSNWTAAGKVNLLGPGLFDVLPGNGLYVSLGYGAILTSKLNFTFTVGKTYRLSFFLAGNQIADFGTQRVTCQVGDGSQFQQVVILPSFSQGMAKYSFNFSPITNLTQPIIISSSAAATDSVDGVFFGPVLTDVRLEDVTDSVLVFDDTFDGENLQFVPASCGVSVAGTIGPGTPAIANPAAPTDDPNINPMIADCAYTFDDQTDVSFEGDGGNNLAGLSLCYSVTYKTAQGETSGFPVLINTGGAFLSTRILFFRDLTLEPTVTDIKVWRSLSNADCTAGNMRLLATLPPNTTFYDDDETIASFQARATTETVPQTNTTGGSPGNMTPGDTYEYQVSWKTATGETAMSPSLTVVVPENIHSLIIQFPGSIPAAVTSMRLWRKETIGANPARFYLMAEQIPTNTNYVDSASHADFQATANASPIPPASNTTAIPAIGYSYYYGYNCYGYGCLSDPPGVQLQDPNPLPDIETSYVPPTTYTSTRSFTAKCPNDTIQNTVGGSIGVTGGNAPFGGSSANTGFTPGFIAISVNVTPDTTSTGNVIVGLDGSTDGITWVPLVTSDPFLAQAATTINLLIPNPDTSYVFYRARLAAVNSSVSCPGTYAFDILTPSGGTGITKNATETSLISQANADQLALAAATLAANTALAVVGCATRYTSTQTATVKCPTGQYDGNNGNGATASGTATSLISQADADQLAWALAQTNAQAILNCSNSNNTAPIAIPAPALQGAGIGPAAPYPSVKFVSGLTGNVTRIRVNLLGFIHANQSDVNMLLVGPNNQMIVLICKCGGNNPLPQTDIILDSNSVTALPQLTTMLAGSFKPTSYGTPAFLPPAPQSGYASDFAILIGQPASQVNGSWSLWIQDVVSLDVGGVNNGWSLVIDMA